MRFFVNWNMQEYFEHKDGDLAWFADFDAQRLRADTAEAELGALRGDVETMRRKNNEYAEKLASAEQRMARHEGMLRHFANCGEVFQVGTAAMDYVAALNPKPEAGSHE